MLIVPFLHRMIFFSNHHIFKIRIINRKISPWGEEGCLMGMPNELSSNALVLVVREDREQDQVTKGKTKLFLIPVCPKSSEKILKQSFSLQKGWLG